MVDPLKGSAVFSCICSLHVKKLYRGPLQVGAQKLGKQRYVASWQLWLGMEYRRPGKKR